MNNVVQLRPGPSAKDVREMEAWRTAMTAAMKAQTAPSLTNMEEAVDAWREYKRLAGIQ